MFNTIACHSELKEKLGVFRKIEPENRLNQTTSLHDLGPNLTKGPEKIAHVIESGRQTATQAELLAIAGWLQDRNLTESAEQLILESGIRHGSGDFAALRRSTMRGYFEEVKLMVGALYRDSSLSSHHSLADIEFAIDSFSFQESLARSRSEVELSFCAEVLRRMRERYCENENIDIVTYQVQIDQLVTMLQGSATDDRKILTERASLFHFLLEVFQGTHEPLVTDFRVEFVDPLRERSFRSSGMFRDSQDDDSETGEAPYEGYSEAGAPEVAQVCESDDTIADQSEGVSEVADVTVIQEDEEHAGTSMFVHAPSDHQHDQCEEIISISNEAVPVAPTEPELPPVVYHSAPSVQLTPQSVPAGSIKSSPLTHPSRAATPKQRGLRMLHTIQEPSAVRVARFHGSRILIGNNQGSLAVTDGSLKEISREFDRHDGSLFCCSTHDRFIATGSNDESVRYTGPGKDVRIAMAVGTVRLIDFLTDSNLIVGCMQGDGLLALDLQTQEICDAWTIPDGYVSSLAMSGPTDWLTVTSTGAVLLWDRRLKKPKVRGKSSVGLAQCGAFGNGRIAVGTREGSMECFDERKLNVPLWKRVGLHQGEIRAIDMTQGKLATVSFDGTLAITGLMEGTILGRSDFSGFRGVSCSWNDRKILVSGASSSGSPITGMCSLFEFND